LSVYVIKNNKKIKTMNVKQWMLSVAMMGVLFATAFANDPDELRQRRSELMKERYEYFKENIKPRIDTERNKLETSLSADDKKEIARIREEVIKQKLMENEFLAEARESMIKGEGFKEGLWQEIEAQRIVIENLYDQAKLIANKYRPEIDDLVADLKEDLRDELIEQNPRQFDGRANRRGLRGQNGPGRGAMMGRGNGAGYGPCMQGGFGPGARGGYGMGNHPGIGLGPFGGFGPGINRGFDIVDFVLWDVNRG
jgi:hypothetical protein